MPFDRLPSNNIQVPLPQLVNVPPRPVTPWTQILSPVLQSIQQAAEYTSPLGRLKRDILMAKLDTERAKLAWEQRIYGGQGGGYGDLPYGYKWGKGPGGVPIPMRMNALELELLKQRGYTGARQAADYGVNTRTGQGWDIQGSLPPSQTQAPLTPKVDLTTPKFEGGERVLEQGATPSRVIGAPSALYDRASDPNQTAHIRHEPDTSPEDYYDLAKLFTAPEDLNAVEPLPDEDKVMIT
jgi:hypothetical protein